MAYFKNFPLVDYTFGDEINTSLFQDISTYIDLIDQVANDASYYEYYNILDNDRPDIVSYKLYGTTRYYWTLFLLNESLRTRGWPLTSKEMEEKASKLYPNTVLTTEEEMHDYFQIGQTVVSIDDDVISISDLQSGITNGTIWKTYDGRGTVISRNLDLGQIVIQDDTGIDEITLTNAGGGYFRDPIVTITNGEGSGASISASVDVSNNGFIGELTLINRGEDFTSNPSITISEPDLINWSTFATSLKQYVDTGSAADSAYTNFIIDTSGNYQYGDINNDGSIDSDDLTIIDNYVLNPSSIENLDRTWIEQTIKSEILNKKDVVPQWFPGGSYANINATATATTYYNTNKKFDEANYIFTAENTTSPDINNWQVADVRFNKVLVKSSNAQINAVHHYEDTNGNWVDINPFLQSGNNSSTLSKTPVTYLNRLKEQNEDNRRIKVLKSSIVEQVFTEFNSLLRNNNG